MPVIVTAPATYTVTTTDNLAAPGNFQNVAGLGCVFYVITSSISGTWTFLLNHVTPSGTVIAVTTVTAGITTNVATNIVLAAPFGLTAATPLPNQVVVTESVAGTVTARYLLSWNGH